MNLEKDENRRKKFYVSLIVKLSATLIVLAIIYAVQTIAANSKKNEGENLAKTGESFEPSVGSETESIGYVVEESSDAAEAAGTETSASTEKNSLNGYHREEYYNGDVYVGDFADGARSGQGTYTWANGVVYSGEWANGKPAGEGNYIYPTEPPTVPPATEPPTTTAAPPATEAPATEPPHYADAPKSDFIQLMLDGAVEIPESEEKIEPPPTGRSLEAQYGAVPIKGDIPEPFGYFKNIVLLGDSVTSGFDIFRGKITFGGEAVLRDLTVVAVGSYGVHSALWDISATSIHPLFNGKQTRPEDIIAAKEAKYVLIAMGLNDISLMSIDDYVSSYALLIERIKEKSPDKTVVIMSVTPLVRSGQKAKLNNAAISQANNALLEFAKANSVPFIDYGAAIRDGENNLYDELSSDAYCHLTIAAYNRLVEYLLHHPLP